MQGFRLQGTSVQITLNRPQPLAAGSCMVFRFCNGASTAVGFSNRSHTIAPYNRSGVEGPAA